MSTKNTIRFQPKDDELPGWRLYTELFEEEDHVYLELEGVEADVTMIGSLWGAGPGTVLLRLPMITARQLGLVSEARSAAFGGNDRPGTGLANAGAKEPGDAPTSHWNYRVIEFRDGEEIWREVREVHYENDQPSAYSSVGASLSWQADENPEVQLTRMQEAISRPVLRPDDFRRPAATAGAIENGRLT